jgi:hypothetical protein
MKKMLSTFVCSVTLSVNVVSVTVTDRQIEGTMDTFGVDRFNNLPNMPLDVARILMPYMQKSQFDHRPRIEKANTIEPSNNCFQADNDLLERLFNYKPKYDVPYLDTLDLSGCENLTNEHIGMMCENSFFYRLKKIVLLNTNVTENGLGTIFHSKIGSVRGIPQVSSRFGKQSTTLDVIISSDKVKKETKTEYRKDKFRITYQTYDQEPSIYTPCDNGIKIFNLIELPKNDGQQKPIAIGLDGISIKSDSSVDDLYNFFGQIQPDSNSFYEKEKLNLFSFDNIYPDHIKSMCQNPFFNKLKEIVISASFGQSKIEYIVETILNSDIGSVRRGPPTLSIDPREGSISHVRIVFVGKRPDLCNIEKKLIKQPFTINYVQANNKPSQMFKPDSNGVKIVEIEFNPDFTSTR